MTRRDTPVYELYQQHFEEPSPSAPFLNEALVIHKRHGQKNQALAIFVHGLGGRRYGKHATWGQFPKFVFDELRTVDVGLYEYRTLCKRFKFWESIKLYDEARIFSDIIRDATNYNTVILAGHSMGGLLCMAAISYFLSSNQKSVLSRVGGLILMATPQTGSQLVPRILSWFSKDFYALKPHGDFVTRIQESFTDHLVLDETLAILGNDQQIMPTWAILGASDFWVDRLSARINLPSNRIKTVHGSHTSIVKPRDNQADAYLFAKDCITKILEKMKILRSLPRESILWKYSLELIAQISCRRPWYNGAPIEKLLEEPVDAPIDISNSILVYGPPNIGKTCWALRQAFYWLEHRSNSGMALWLNASRDKPDLLAVLEAQLPAEAEILFVIDDLHFAPRADVKIWVESLAAIRKHRRNSVVAVWISRDGSLAPDLLESGGHPPLLYPFPVENITKLYTMVLHGYEPWQRIIAAFETRLDPRIAQDLLNRVSPQADGFDKHEAFTVRLRDEVRNYSNSLLDERQKVLGGMYETYLLLLPNGCIGYPMRATLLGKLGGVSVRALEEQGLVLSTDDSITLTEHPFQVRRLLDALRNKPESARLANTLLAHRFPNCPHTVSIAEAVFARYLSMGNAVVEVHRCLEELAHHAEYTGIREPFTAALGFLLGRSDWVNDEQLKDRALDWHCKLARLCYPENDSQFRENLAKDRARWVEREGEARRASNWKAGDRRLDTILYEIGYIDYLCEDYPKATESFSESVEAGFAAIERGMLAEAGTPERSDGTNAFAHIWIAGVCERSTQLRLLFAKALDRAGFEEVKEATIRLTTEIALIHARLAAANSAPSADSALLYVDALRAVRPEWQPPAHGTPIQRTERIEGHLGRHELNAWLEALQTSCWPALFGKWMWRVPTIVDSEYRPALPPPAPLGGETEYRIQGAQLMYRWAENLANDNLEDSAISTAALIRASGGYERLGDFVLLAWRCTSSAQKADALGWYLSHEVRSVGCNSLPKAAFAHRFR